MYYSITVAYTEVALSSSVVWYSFDWSPTLACSSYELIVFVIWIEVSLLFTTSAEASLFYFPSSSPSTADLSRSAASSCLFFWVWAVCSPFSPLGCPSYGRGLTFKGLAIATLADIYYYPYGNSKSGLIVNVYSSDRTFSSSKAALAFISGSISLFSIVFATILISLF